MPAPLKVTITDKNGSKDDYVTEYVSFINSGTYGIPGVIAQKSGPLKVLYVNTECVDVMTIEREGGDTDAP